MQVVDTHCHIHEAQTVPETNDPVRAKWLKAGKDDPDRMIAAAAAEGVTSLICVGTDVADSELAVEFARQRPHIYASIGIHPHEAHRYADGSEELTKFSQLAGRPDVVAIGECGLDYYYDHSPKPDQNRILRFQIELALANDLPMIFHVRDAFEDFWPVFDNYQGIRGVIHSFTANRQVLDQALSRGLFIGLNGIITFTKDQEQLAAAKMVPIDRMLLETDAPYLTPAPIRGKICEPKHAMTILRFIAQLQGRTDQQVADETTANARRLFNLRG